MSTLRHRTMTLRLGFCFFFHQPLGENAARAGRIGYRGFLGVLQNHPRMKFNLMLSGTLLGALGWFDPALVETVRRGVESGTFRMLGSLYAQSMPLALDEMDCLRQIRLHRDDVRKYFGEEPSAFWSPQRTGSARLAPLLVRCGYRFLPLEDGQLRRAGADRAAVFRLPADGGDLKLLWDDASLRARFDYAAFFHAPSAFSAALEGWKNAADAERLVPICSEDAGAFGLRPHDLGLDPRADFAGLDALLDYIEADPVLRTAFLDEAPEEDTEIARLPDGWSRDLDRAILDPTFPVHEEGYGDWSDFNARAPRLRYFRYVHNAVRLRMDAAEKALRSGKEDPESVPSLEAGVRLFALAERAYCAHQSEFGCVGVGGRGDPAWEGVGAAIALAKAAERARGPSGRVAESVIDDLTADGEDEILLRSGDHLAILSPYGGRLLHWIDLRSGSLHVGNPLAVPVGTMLIEARSPEAGFLPEDNPPDEKSPLPEPKIDGRFERRLAWLAAEHLPDRSGPLPVWPRQVSAALKPALPARRRALNDFFSLDGGPEEESEARLDFRLAGGSATFLRFFGYRLRMVKRVRLAENGVRVMYRFQNVDSRVLRLRLRLVSELCPDYHALFDSPGRALEPVKFGRRRCPGILNTRTGRILVSHASRPAAEAPAFQQGVLAWELTQTFAFSVEPGRAETILVRLNLYPGKGPAGASFFNNTFL